MTDNEIIKALEMCCNDITCKGCPYREGAGRCVRALTEDTLDLINRQKAAIEELKEEIADLQKAKVVYSTVDYCESDLTEALKENERLKAEIERLQMELDTIVTSQKTIRRLTADEFAERLENKLANNTDISAVGYQSVIAEIDNLVKEMVGGSE